LGKKDTDRMRIKTKIVASVLLGQMLTGCTFSGFALRDDYWGKGILQQALFLRGVTHDADGTPVLATQDDLLIKPPGAPDVDDADEDEGL
jgi:hypothetical protein